MKIRIGKIDTHGWCGRDLHPEPSDQGTSGSLLKAATVFYSVDQPVDSFEDGQELTPEQCSLVPEDCKIIVFWVAMPDGRIVELMEHEVLD